jgi:thiol-disulfide isomerase/thioredoxin
LENGFMLAHRLLFASLLLVAGMAGAATTLDTQWTKAAIKKNAAAPIGAQQQLPELRVYDASHRLILRSFGLRRGAVGETLTAAMRRDAPVAGPRFEATMSELETRDGRPARLRVGGAKYVVVDYWATWCAPCKVLGAELDGWAARQPNGSVQIVRAEADFLAAARAAGATIRRYKQGPDGKLIEIKE